ncbi:MAG: hypothetical protein HKN04_02155 [Rhodothermaceae bacterium]|nr:hypothetical protein [Rhodothermaceae bacterium]
MRRLLFQLSGCLALGIVALQLGHGAAPEHALAVALGASSATYTILLVGAAVVLRTMGPRPRRTPSLDGASS